MIVILKVNLKNKFSFISDRIETIHTNTHTNVAPQANYTRNLTNQLTHPSSGEFDVRRF